MTISAKLANEIDTAVNAFLKKLWEPLLKRDSMIWHYTTGDTAIKVLNYGNIWTTQISGLNDSLELRYAAMLYKESLISVATSSPDGKTKDFIQRYISLIQDSDAIPMHAVLALNPKMVHLSSLLKKLSLGRDGISTYQASA